MTRKELVLRRLSADLTQTQMAVYFGLSLRRYADLERDDNRMNETYAAAAERIFLRLAVEQGKASLVPSSVMRDLKAVAKLKG